jgi:carbon-monoxide dehydrogenase medium subunit
VKPARFDYRRPESLPEALELLARHGADAAVLSGGQSLMPMLNLRVARPALLLDINRLPGLDGIHLDAERLTIGARARHADVLRSGLVREAAPLLTEALTHVAHAAIRNRGSFGGSLALADPAAELPACSVCLDAEIIAASLRGERRIRAADFFLGPYSTALEPAELLLRVEVPRHGPGWRFAFAEVARRYGDFAIAGMALAARIEDGRVAESRIVPCGVEPAPRRLEAVEAALAGAALGDLGRHAAAAEALAGTLEPMEWGEYPAAYRRHLAGVLLGRTLDRIAKEAAHGRA